MPLDAASGVFYGVHGRGRPLLIGLPLMASFTSLFGEELRPVLDGYLSRLTDRYQVLLVDYPSIGGSQDIAPEALTADRVCADLLAVAPAAQRHRLPVAGQPARSQGLCRTAGADQRTLAARPRTAGLLCAPPRER